MIKKVINKLKKVFIPKSELEKINDLEAPIFKFGSGHFSHGFSPYGSIKSENYSTVPAPVVTPTDNWFSAPVKTEKVVAYEKHVAQKIEEQRIVEAAQPKKETKNIHEEMYQRASRYWGTWKEELPGGSENFQSGSGSWNSGTGMGQFK